MCSPRHNVECFRGTQCPRSTPEWQESIAARTLLCGTMTFSWSHNRPCWNAFGVNHWPCPSKCSERTLVSALYRACQLSSGSVRMGQQHAALPILDRASAAVLVTPGICAISRSNMPKNASHLTCLGDKFCAVRPPVSQGDVVCVREHLWSFQIMLPLLHCVDQGEHLALVCGLIALRGV